ncbi:protein TonB [Rhodoblastus acidophilus]|uniref:TonB family protein n=1 Tax=Rhodoblastus acidophilus TaxID=1074 RepID=UPI00222569B3|nr:TonB family protein [Rhodoblastus acidophilus]MCW2318729.1 protein TonB [Rhodoblastus acidophilus]
MAICFLLHAVPIWLFIKVERLPDPTQGEQEIPVEIVVEPPPEKQEPPPAPNEKPLDEKIATDAPRPADEDKVEKDAHDSASHSPQTTPNAQPVAPPPADAIASKPDSSAAGRPIDHDPDGEPVQATPSVEPQERQEPPRPAPPSKAPQKPAQDPMSAFAALPDYSIAAVSKKAPVATGKAAPTYLSIVYGLVMSRIRYPEGAAGHGPNMGEIVFAVDAAGRLVGQRIVKSSGSPELDLAAMAAIRAGSPFPPPPTAAGISLNLRYRR